MRLARARLLRYCIIRQCRNKVILLSLFIHVIPGGEDLYMFRIAYNALFLFVLLAALQPYKCSCPPLE